MNHLLFTLGDGINDWIHKFWFRPANSDLAVDANGHMLFEGVDWLFIFILWVCVISFVLLMVPMCYWSWKYRRRPGVPAIRTPNHNLPLEVCLVTGPLIVVTFIFFWGFHGYCAPQLPYGNAIEILVTAKKWSWSATYPNSANSIDTCWFDYRKEGEKVIHGTSSSRFSWCPRGCR